MKQRDHFLDIAKGIAILMVIITHFSWEGEERLRYLFPFWISMAVPIFLTISGYVGTASYEKKGIESISRAYDKTILIHKLIRYSVPFSIAYLFDIVFYTFTEKKLGLLEIIVRFFRGGIGGWGTYYYPILMQFIFVFPVIYFIIKRCKNGLWLCFALNVSYEIFVKIYMLNGECYRLLVFRYILLIAYGCYLYENQGNDLGRKNWILFIAGTVFIVAANYLNYSPLTISYWKRTCVYSVLYFMPLFGLAMKYLKNIRCRILELLGNASYHIFFIQMLYYNYWSESIGALMPNRACHLLGNIVICVSLGIVFYYVESPFSKFILRKTDALMTRRNMVSPSA